MTWYQQAARGSLEDFAGQEEDDEKLLSSLSVQKCWGRIICIINADSRAASAIHWAISNTIQELAALLDFINVLACPFENATPPIL